MFYNSSLAGPRTEYQIHSRIIPVIDYVRMSTLVKCLTRLPRALTGASGPGNGEATME